jgi:hypothetical protein
MAHVEAVCISVKKGTVKREQPSVKLVEEWANPEKWSLC